MGDSWIITTQYYNLREAVVPPHLNGETTAFWDVQALIALLNRYVQVRLGETVAAFLLQGPSRRAVTLRLTTWLQQSVSGLMGNSKGLVIYHQHLNPDNQCAANLKIISRNLAESKEKFISTNLIKSNILKRSVNYRYHSSSLVKSNHILLFSLYQYPMIMHIQNPLQLAQSLYMPVA